MALIRKSQVDEWVNIHGGKSAAELSMELRDNMTGYIGPGGAAKGRLMSGEQVVVLQLLYNKLVEMGKFPVLKSRLMEPMEEKPEAQYKIYVNL